MRYKSRDLAANKSLNLYFQINIINVKIEVKNRICNKKERM